MEEEILIMRLSNSMNVLRLQRRSNSVMLDQDKYPDKFIQSASLQLHRRS